MAFVLFQSGSSLQLFNQNGTLSTLTLPTGVTLATDRKPRFAVYGAYTVMVNTPNVPLTIDSAGVVRVLCPQPPRQAIGLASGGVGTLTGSYRARQTFLIRDLTGAVIAESDFSPLNTGAAFAASSNLINATPLNLSQDAISGSRLYRTTTLGSTYFQWLDVDGNTLTVSDNDDASDAALSIIAAPTLGTPPNMTLVASWRDRLWGVDRVDIDFLRCSEAAIPYAWSATNTFKVGKVGSDKTGISGIIPRRDALGLGRREGLFQLTGTSTADFRVVTLAENSGVTSQETVVVWKDIAYFLWKDGVYQWGPEGVKCISDGKTRTWFTTDSYFNRARFTSAFATIDPINNKYRLYLALVGSSTENAWVEYDITDQTWWGPHVTSVFATPSAAAYIQDANDNFLTLVASGDGFLWKDDGSVFTDGANAAIVMSVDTKFHDANTPNVDKYWGELEVIGKVQPVGTMTITPRVGYLDAAAQASISYDMTKGRQRLRRLGIGKLLQLNIAQSTVGVDAEIYGYSIEDVHEVGRR